MADTYGISKSPTGIEGFDDLTLGGLPTGRPTLVCGAAGCGKTLFASTFLVHGARDCDEPGVFVTFEERSEDIRRNVVGFGWDVARWEAENKWAFVDASIQPGEPTVVSGDQMNTGNEPFALGPVYISYSPSGDGTTVFG